MKNAEYSRLDILYSSICHNLRLIYMPLRTAIFCFLRIAIKRVYITQKRVKLVTETG